MRKLILIVVGLLTLAGCKKSSFVAKFDETPEVRIGKEMAKVKDMLSTSPSGWVATTPTGDGGGYSFHMSFDATENVTMYADMNDVTSTKSIASYYRIKQDAGVDLVFDTYCYLTWLNDPDPSTFGGNAKTGFKSDVDFIYQRSTPDSIFFLGKRYRQPLTLVKATAAQKASYAAGELKTAMDKFKTFFSTTKYPYIEMVTGGGTLKAAITANSTNNVSAGKRVSFTGVLTDGKTVVSSSSKFAFKLDGVDLLGTGLVYNGITFVRFAWKDATTLAIYDSTGKEYIVKSNPTPLTPLFILLGAGYNSVAVPNATTFPGWGADFISRRATCASSITRWSILNPRGALRLQGINFTFNDVTKKMVAVFDTPDGATAFSLTFNYTYTKTDAGVFKFTLGAIGGNETAIGGDLAPLLAQRIDVDTFTVDYFTHPTTGALLAQFKSIEHPDFTFTGAL